MSLNKPRSWWGTRVDRKWSSFMSNVTSRTVRRALKTAVFLQLFRAETFVWHGSFSLSRFRHRHLSLSETAKQAISRWMRWWHRLVRCVSCFCSLGKDGPWGTLAAQLQYTHTHTVTKTCMYRLTKRLVFPQEVRKMCFTDALISVLSDLNTSVFFLT